MMGWWIWGVAAALATPPMVSVGQHALTFSLPVVNADSRESSEEGLRVALSQYVGILPQEPKKAVIIYFFTKRDGSDNLANLNRLQRRHENDGLAIVGINTDPGAVGGLSVMLEDLRLDYPVLRDNHQVVVQRYGFDNMPVALVVDQQGYIFAIGQPGAGNFIADLESEISPLLNQ